MQIVTRASPFTGYSIMVFRSVVFGTPLMHRLGEALYKRKKEEEVSLPCSSRVGRGRLLGTRRSWQILRSATGHSTSSSSPDSQTTAHITYIHAYSNMHWLKHVHKRLPYSIHQVEI